jgi:hypothetical protein
MSKLVINDLAVGKDLDRAAAMQICGGFSFSTGAIVARHKQQGFSGLPTGSFYNVINNIDFDYNVYNNATLFNVYNDAHNSGAIVNNIDFSALTLTAASQTQTG